MTERAGPEDNLPAEQTKPNAHTGRHVPAGDTNATAVAGQPRDSGSWAPKVDRLSVTCSGSRGVNVAGRRLRTPGDLDQVIVSSGPKGIAVVTLNSLGMRVLMTEEACAPW